MLDKTKYSNDDADTIAVTSEYSTDNAINIIKDNVTIVFDIFCCE